MNPGPRLVRASGLLGALLAPPLALAALPGGADEKVDYARDVRPILERSCFECHGENERDREADLRLDVEQDAYADRGGYAAWIPGNLEDSEAWYRITDEDDPMPPADWGPMLSAEEQATIRRWIEEGAEWSEVAPEPQPEAAPEPPAFDFQGLVRPILAEHCFACHGPDEGQREADLRLDVRDDAIADRGDYAAFWPGDEARSEALLRITDPDDPMPPSDHGEMLSASDVAILRSWVAAGAPWQEHWAYVTPRRPALPEVSDPDWVINPIDRFVLARLDAEGLAPSPEADRATLLRRASLDLTGLPPTVEELDTFLTDRSPGAYERAIERLLASPRYGEEMATEWLDAARFGDTHGFHLDNVRSLWRWRDWVIDAYNANKPFDEFTIEQLAGDLLPDPTMDQRIATGFNRCNPTTGEGGLIAEEYLAKYASDRVETTATVWLGTTLGCATCHDHKYDPFSQKEFYELFAFFNSIDEQASDGNALAPPPSIRAPYPHQEGQLEAIEAELAAYDARLDGPLPEVDAEQRVWERGWEQRLAGRWDTPEVLQLTSKAVDLRVLEDGSVLAEGEDIANETYEILVRTDLPEITAIQLEAIAHDHGSGPGLGRASHHNIVLTGFEVEAVAATQPQRFEPIELVGARADYAQPNYPISGTLDDDPQTGWACDNGDSESRVALFTPREPIGHEGGTLLRIRMRHDSRHVFHNIGRFRLSLTADKALLPATFGNWYSAGPFPAPNYDLAYATAFVPEQGVDLTWAEGDLAWVERPEFVDGAIHDLPGTVCATYLFREVYAASDTSVELAIGSDDGIRIWVNGASIHDNRSLRGVAPDQDRVTLPLREGRNELLYKIVNNQGGFAFTTRIADEGVGGPPLEILAALQRSDGLRSEADRAAIRAYYRRNHSPGWAELAAERDGVRARRDQVQAEIPVTMVMAERMEARPAHFLIRGEYDNKGEQVFADVPAILPPMAEEWPRNRLGLARWLVDPAHPLTARVTVNRYWQRYFGSGLVDTPEDFGSRGSWPTHPELLDWLAREFVDGGWDVKAMQRLIVTSATYRQDSRVSEALVERDPDNRLFARGPRFRLDAEAIRDHALHVSGLLVERLGGPSVKPYQPDGLWFVVAYTSSNTARFVQDSGEDLYRRSMYTFWKRTSPPPTMSLFDAPSREACAVNRPRTNTPLQALALLNDVQFVEAARHFAARMLREGGATEDDRIVWGFRAATAREPNVRELEVLRSFLRQQLSEYRLRAEDAAALVSTGDSPVDEDLDAAEHAAWTVLANLILNLDEVVTRG